MSNLKLTEKADDVLDGVEVYSTKDAEAKKKPSGLESKSDKELEREVKRAEKIAKREAKKREKASAARSKSAKAKPDKEVKRAEKIAEREAKKQQRASEKSKSAEAKPDKEVKRAEKIAEREAKKQEKEAKRKISMTTTVSNVEESDLTKRNLFEELEDLITKISNAVLALLGLLELGVNTVREFPAIVKWVIKFIFFSGVVGKKESEQ
ncbi:MAG: hypothetical protein SVY15_04230 [Halobacteriota archaeon]|nr:hypothetical protein [Halobacteriota archaeon]